MIFCTIAVICSITMCINSSLRSKSPFNVIILLIFCISKSICIVVSVVSVEYKYYISGVAYKYSYYISGILTFICLIILFILAKRNQIKNSLRIEVTSIILFYFFIICIILAIRHAYNPIYLLVIDCLFLIVSLF